MTSLGSNFIPTMTLIRRGANTALGISFDFQSFPGLMPDSKNFQLWIGQAIERWYSLLSPAQKSALPALQLSLKISASCPPPKQE
ncbi:MAG: hypothetical protein KGL39_07175 [Patescibacteria group bacterium]|nr:hypothetical protein [Patescibacteria group bacterium]